MRFSNLGLAAIPIALGLFAAPVQAAVTLPDIQTIETRLCPVGGASALRLGIMDDAQDPALRRAFSGRNAPIAPFIESRADYTVWSGKLAAVEFNGGRTDGTDDQAFVDGMVGSLEASGWQLSERRMPHFISVDNPKSYEKMLPAVDGPRLMVLQFSANGGVSLRCGDPELLWLSKDEELEKLAPGSLRPATPVRPEGPLGRLRPEDCSRPEVRDNFEKLLNDDTHLEFTGASDDAAAQSRYQRRLHTWLRWKIVASGKVDGDALWEIEEKAGKIDGGRLENDFIGFVGDIVALDDAAKNGDPEGKCRALAGILSKASEHDLAEAKRLAKVNAALEAEGRRLGVNLD